MNENDKFAKDLADEAKKLGFDNVEEGQEHLNLDDDEDEDIDDKGDLEDDEEEGDEEDSDSDEDSDEEDEDSEDDSDDEDDSDEDGDDSDDDDDDDKDRKKKVIPFKKYNQLRKDLRAANKKIVDLAAEKSEIEAKLPDDYQARVDALIKDTGVNDPETLKKILDFTKGLVDNNEKKNEERLTKLEKELAQSRPIVDEFTTEWPTFKEKSFIKAFPNATEEQVKLAEKLMHTLAHDKKTGGKLYVDEKTGKALLDPYELDYIFFKNRSQFESIVTGKKVKGMESARTNRITVENESDEGKPKKLTKDSSAKDILAMDKMYSQEEAGVSALRAPENDTI